MVVVDKNNVRDIVTQFNTINMKKIKLIGKLKINKIKVSELNNQANIIGGDYDLKTRRAKACETLTYCDYTYPYCVSKKCAESVMNCIG